MLGAKYDSEIRRAYAEEYKDITNVERSKVQAYYTDFWGGLCSGSFKLQPSKRKNCSFTAQFDNRKHFASPELVASYIIKELKDRAER